MRTITISMENLPTPGATVEEEREIPMYAKIGDPTGLEHAFHKEAQIQAEIKQPVGKIRVRETIPMKPGGDRVPSGPVVWELTTKHRTEGGLITSNREKTTAITEDQFHQFVSVCSKFQSKIRYCFRVEKMSLGSIEGQAEIEIEGLKYEVDVFVKEDGTFSEWCKIDVEIQGIEQQLKNAGVDIGKLDLSFKLTALPFQPHSIVVDIRDGDAEKLKLITMLYDQEFLRPVPDFYRD